MRVRALGQDVGMTESPNLAEAFYQGAWLPCRVLDPDTGAGTLLVSVTDRTGVHEVSLAADQVRGR